MNNAYIHYWLWKIQGSGLALFSEHLFGSKTGLHRSGDLLRRHGSHMGQSIISRSKIEGFETDGPEVSQGAGESRADFENMGKIKGSYTQRVYHFLYDKIMEEKQETEIGNGESKEKRKEISEKPPSPQPSSDGNNKFTTEAVAETDEFDDAEEIEDTPQWKEAKKILDQEEPRLSPIFDLFTSRMTDSGLAIEGPNVIVMRSIEQNHGDAIARALEHVGCSTFFFGVQPIEIRQMKEKQYQAKELKAARQAEEARRKTAADRAAEKERLLNLPLKQQFEMLSNEYPLKKSRWMAWRVFVKMANRNELPNISVLLQSVRNHKTLDTSWKKDNGRWIPALPKWLRERRWIDKPSG